MKKRIISTILAAVLVVSLTACGGDKKEASEKESGKPQVVENYVPTYPIVDEEITITGLVVGADRTTSEDRLVWQKVEEVTGINIEWEFVDQEALATRLAGGDWPDFFLTSFDDAIVNDYGITGGRFVNLLDYIGYMPNLAKAYEDYPDAKKASTELNGEIYEFVGISSAVTGVYVKPFYRTDLMNKAGVTEAPKTITEFKDTLSAVKKYTGKAPWIARINQEQNYWTLPVYSAFGTSDQMRFDVDKDGNVVFMRTSEQMKNYYKFMHELYSEGLIHPESVTIENNTRNELELGGDVLLIETAQTALTGSYFDSGKVELAALAPLTSEFDSTQTYQKRSPVEFKSGPFLNAESDYIVEMCKMFDIMYATEEVVENSGLYGVSFTYGIEGEDWDFTETGYEYHTPEKYGTSSNTYIYAEVIWNNAGRNDAFANIVAEGEGNNAVRQQQYAQNVIPYTNDTYIWNFMKFSEDEQRILDNHWADIYSYYQKTEAEFITGVKDIDAEWNNYCKQLKNMGIDEVLEVYQAAYERWIAN